MSPYEELRLLLALVPEDSQGEKQVCPFCGGGRSGEKSLDIARFQGNSGTYQCKRAQCAKGGYIGQSYGTHYRPVIQQKEWAPRIYDGTIEVMPDEQIERYADKYGWTCDEVRSSGVGWSPEYQRSVWKISSPTGFVRGIELRTLNPYSRTKTLHFRHSADPWVGYVGLGLHREARAGDQGERIESQISDARVREVSTTKCLVAVEDLLSAYRVGMVYPTAAIMGSHLTFETLVDLMKVSENIVLCLDRDATDKAEKFAKRYSFLCPGFVHIPLQRDLKYEHPDKIKEIISEAL